MLVDCHASPDLASRMFGKTALTGRYYRPLI